MLLSRLPEELVQFVRCLKRLKAVAVLNSGNIATKFSEQDLKEIRETLESYMTEDPKIIELIKKIQSIIK